MRQKAASFLHLLLGALLGLLGFSSCGFLDIGGGKDMYGPPLVMYGQPHADFHASGKVTDPSGKGIEGIRVAIRQHRHYDNRPGVIYDQNDWYDDDTLYTDDAGKYELKTSIISFDGPHDVTVVFEDIDGEEHGGRFESQTVKPEIKQSKKGDNSWYGGTFEVKADAKLKKQ